MKTKQRSDGARRLLSLVLALAMIFSLAVTGLPAVYADPAPDEATAAAEVEQPADNAADPAEETPAETPEDAAETPDDAPAAPAIAKAPAAFPSDEEIAGKFNGGDGKTAETAYQIATADQLAYLATLVNEGDNWSQGKFFKLTADIDLSGKAWTPIGATETYNETVYSYVNTDKYFRGDFDGAKHNITGLTISVTGTTKDGISEGLFGSIGGGANLHDFVVSGTVTMGANSNLGSNIRTGAAGVAGFAYLDGIVTIYNVGNEVNVTGESTVGGIVGAAAVKDAFKDNNSNKLSITNCYNRGTIYAGSNTAKKPCMAGGIFGAANENKGFTVSIDSCYNTGSVTVDTASTDNCYPGGIAGVRTYDAQIFSITNCFNASPVAFAKQMQGNRKNNYATKVPGGIFGFDNASQDNLTLTNDYYLQGVFTSNASNSPFNGKNGPLVGGTGKYDKNKPEQAKDIKTSNTTGAFTKADGLTADKMKSNAFDGTQQIQIGSDFINVPRLAWEPKPVTYPTVTFNVAENGSYTVAGEAITADGKTLNNAQSYALSAKPASDEYQFLGWYDVNNNKYISLAQTYLLEPENDITVTAKFEKISGTNYDVAGRTFDTWDQALAYARQDGVEKLITMVKDQTLSSNLTIPAGYTLRIPINAQKDLCGGTELENGAVHPADAAVKPSPFKTLTMAENSSITVNGSLEIGGTYYSPVGSQPGQMTGPYGLIKMASGSSITVNDGGTLDTRGYILGNGSVTAKSGATVYEWFQFTDFRGGTASNNMANARGGKQAFPFSQYYVQNIEVPLTLEAGASENVYCSVKAKLPIEPSQRVHTGVVSLIGDSGLLHVTKGSIVKEYKKDTDRIEYTISGEAELKDFTVSLAGQNVNTKDYNLIMPITNNMTINVEGEGSKLTVTQDASLLPGAKLIIGEGARMDVAAGTKLYVYDSTDWKVGYVHPSASFIPLPFVPDRSSPNVRTALDDAEIDVNGTLTVNGEVYTTVGGANIHSSNGKGVYEQADVVGYDDVTYQYTQSGTDVSRQEITIYPAQLKNNDGSYFDTGILEEESVTSEGGYWGHKYAFPKFTWDGNKPTGATTSCVNGDEDNNPYPTTISSEKRNFSVVLAPDADAAIYTKLLKLTDAATCDKAGKVYYFARTGMSDYVPVPAGTAFNTIEDKDKGITYAAYTTDNDNDFYVTKTETSEAGAVTSVYAVEYKAVDSPALGHDIKVTWDWSADHKTATATFTCTRGDLTDTATATGAAITSEVKDGNKVFTAKVTYKDTEYTGTDKIKNESTIEFVYADGQDANWGWIIKDSRSNTGSGTDDYRLNGLNKRGQQITEISGKPGTRAEFWAIPNALEGYQFDHIEDASGKPVPAYNDSRDGYHSMDGGKNVREHTFTFPEAGETTTYTVVFKRVDLEKVTFTVDYDTTIVSNVQYRTVRYFDYNGYGNDTRTFNAVGEDAEYRDISNNGQITVNVGDTLQFKYTTKTKLDDGTEVNGSDIFIADGVYYVGDKSVTFYSDYGVNEGCVYTYGSNKTGYTFKNGDTLKIKVYYDGYTPIYETDDFTVYTRNTRNWLKTENGPFKSNLASGYNDTYLKIVPKHGGVITLDYKLDGNVIDLGYGEYEYNGALYYKVGDELTDIYNADNIDNISEFQGKSDWKQLKIVAKAEQAVYLDYNGYEINDESWNPTGKWPSAEIKDIKVEQVGAKVTAFSSDESIGTVAITGLEADGTTYIGSELTVTAAAAQDCQFLRWVDVDTGKTVSTNAVYTFVVSKDTNLKAVFTQTYLDVTAASSDTSLGSAEITSGVTDGKAEYGKNVTVKATNAAGEFLYWIDADANKVVSSKAEYTFKVERAINLKAVFAPKSVTNGVAKINNVKFATLEDAFNYAKAGSTVVLIANYTQSRDITIPEGVTLLLPYADGKETIGGSSFDNGNGESTGMTADITQPGTSVTRKLTLAEGVNVTVPAGARLIVGGTIGGYQSVCGGTLGAHSEIALGKNSSIDVNGGTLSVLGYITGEGTVNATANSTVYEPLVLLDFQGGTNLSYRSSDKVMFWNSYALMNIQSTLNIHSGAKLKVYATLRASSGFGTVPMDFISESGILQLADGASVSFKYTNDKAVTIPNNNAKERQVTIGRSKVTINGNVTFGSMKASVLFYTLDTKDLYFSIPYTFDFVQETGTLSLGSKVAILPGASVTINKGANLNVTGGLLVYDGLNHKSNFIGAPYPTKELSKAGLLERGTLTVNGAMNVKSGATFAGVVQNGGTGTVVIENGAKVAETGLIGASSQNERTQYSLKAQYIDCTTGALADMTAGNTYDAKGDKTLETASYAYTDMSGKAQTKNYETAEKITGSWRERKATYTVTWVVDGTKETQAFNYGATPKYTGAEPAKNADEFGPFKFAGWDPAIAAVTDDVTYTAKFVHDGIGVKFVKPDGGKVNVNSHYVANTNTYYSVDGKFTVSATADNGKQFLYWIDGDGNVISTKATDELTLAANQTVKAVFGENGQYFDVQGRVFNTWADAKAFDEKIADKDKTITLVQNYDLTSELTIDAGYTLVIPVDEQNNLFAGESGAVANKGNDPSPFVTMTVKDGGKIVVDGTLAVGGTYYAASGGKSGQMTGKYGLIKLDSDKNTITVNGTLDARGYITGAGSVTANSGATVYEWMQIADFRGGSASSQMGSVLPFSQYYVQNIEAPLTIKSGATEKAHAAVYLSSTDYGIIVTSDVNFIGKGGLLELAGNSSVTKKYDGAIDRIDYTISGDATLSSITISSGNDPEQSGGDRQTSSLIMPITSNMTINVAGGTLSIAQNASLLPGAKIAIAKDATVSVNDKTSLYVYDSDDWNGKGYVNSKANVDFIPVPYAPGRTAPNVRTTLDDAEIEVNGTLEAKGGIYTTENGANIWSKDGGEYKQIGAVGTETETYQYTQSGTSVTQCTVNITPAQLKHIDGGFFYTDDLGKTDTVVNEKGHWGHKYAFPTFVWDANNSATATIKCVNDAETLSSGDDFELNVYSGANAETYRTLFNVSDVERACTTKGETYYFALANVTGLLSAPTGEATKTAKVGGTTYASYTVAGNNYIVKTETSESGQAITVYAVGYKAVESNALGHEISVAWQWSADHTSATATFTCTRGDVNETVKASIKVVNNNDGTKTYTATAEYENETYTDRKNTSIRTITWTNYDGKNSSFTTNVEDGISPVYPDIIPTKASENVGSKTEQVRYRFIGWRGTDGKLYTNNFPAVSGDATYAAEFKQVKAYYNVAINVKLGDMAPVLQYTTDYYNANAARKLTVPATYTLKNDDGSSTNYVFDHWEVSLGGDAVTYNTRQITIRPNQGGNYTALAVYKPGNTAKTEAPDVHLTEAYAEIVPGDQDGIYSFAKYRTAVTMTFTIPKEYTIVDVGFEVNVNGKTLYSFANWSGKDGMFSGAYTVHINMTKYQDVGAQVQAYLKVRDASGNEQTFRSESAQTYTFTGLNNPAK